MSPILKLKSEVFRASNTRTLYFQTSSAPKLQDTSKSKDVLQLIFDFYLYCDGPTEKAIFEGEQMHVQI